MHGTETEVLTQIANWIRKNYKTSDNNQNLEDTVIKLGGRVSYTMKLRSFADGLCYPERKTA